ncbi:S41 family peptidase [Nocardiopsis sp. NPDC055551]
MASPTLGTNLRRLVTTLDGAVDRAYEADGLAFRAAFTPVTRALLRHLSLSVGGLARETGMTRSATSQTVAQMRRLDLLVPADSEDGRERRVRLSPSCLEQLPAVERRWRLTAEAALELDRELGTDLNGTVSAALDVLERRPFLPRDSGGSDAEGIDTPALVDEVADLVERNYVHPEIASRAAAGLRGRALGEARSLPAVAAALTEVLRPYDGHFRVVPTAEIRRRDRRSRARVDDVGFDVTEREGVLVVDVAEFTHLAPETESGRRLTELARERLRPLAEAEAVVFDLRGTPGGAPSMVEFLIDHLVPGTPVEVVAFHPRDGEVWRSWTPADPENTRRPDVPVCVLVDAGTASAAESFALALRTLGRAILVGHRTAGAANPGDYFAASSGLSVFVSTGAPRDPRSGQGWEGTGLEPDLACHAPLALDHALTHLRGHP